MIYEITVGERTYPVEVRREGEWWLCRVDGREWKVSALLPRPDVLSMVIEGAHYDVRRERTALGTNVWIGGARYSVEARDPPFFPKRLVRSECHWSFMAESSIRSWGRFGPASEGSTVDMSSSSSAL